MAELTETAQNETLVGRKEELRELLAAIHKRESRLVWGPVDVGKTALIKKAISELPEAERQNCVYSSGPVSRRKLLSHFVGRLYELGDVWVRKKVHADGATEVSLNRWLQKQTSLRLRGILFTASMQGDYRFFIDHFSTPTYSIARLMKEIIYQCKTPIYLAALDHSQAETGYAWSLYWSDALRIHVGPLNQRMARQLLENCIRSFGLDSLDLEGFREEILRVSGHVPGSIVKMCELASQDRYHYGDQIKFKLVYLDYLTQANRASFARVQTLAS